VAFRRISLDRGSPESLARVASRLIAIAFSLVGAMSKVREYMQCSESDFLEYSAAHKAPSKAELERLVELIARQQSNSIAKSRELLLEIRARLEKFDGF
jgi:hypothetical protein